MTQRQKEMPWGEDRTRIKALDEAISEWRQLEHDAKRLKAKADMQEGHIQFLLGQNQRAKYVYYEGGMKKWVELRAGKAKLHYDEIPENTLKRTNGQNARTLTQPSKAQVPSDADKKRVKKTESKAKANSKGKPFKLGDVAKRGALKTDKSNGKSESVTTEVPNPTGGKSDAS